MDPLLIISFKSFSSIWYWLITGTVWSMACHWTVGVPFDALVRAHQKGGTFAEDAEVLALINARRIAHVMQVAGPFITAFVFFFLAALGTFAFVYGYELAQALFVLLVPLVLVHGLNMRLGLRIIRIGLAGEDLRKALLRRRFWNQVIGLVSIVLAVFVAFISFASEMVWY